MMGRFHCATLLTIAILGRHRWSAQGESTAGGKAATEPLHKSCYRIIDIHAHAPFPSEKAPRVHLEMLDRVGVTAVNVLLLDGSGWPILGRLVGNELARLARAAQCFPERLLVFGTVDFNRVAKELTFFADIVTELERIASRGMQGIKIWKNLGMYHKDADGKLLRIDDPRLDLFWKMCSGYPFSSTLPI